MRGIYLLFLDPPPDAINGSVPLLLSWRPCTRHPTLVIYSTAHKGISKNLIKDPPLSTANRNERPLCGLSFWYCWGGGCGAGMLKTPNTPFFSSEREGSSKDGAQRERRAYKLRRVISSAIEIFQGCTQSLTTSLSGRLLVCRPANSLFASFRFVDHPVLYGNSGHVCGQSNVARAPCCRCCWCVSCGFCFAAPLQEVPQSNRDDYPVLDKGFPPKGGLTSGLSSQVHRDLPLSKPPFNDLSRDFVLSQLCFFFFPSWPLFSLTQILTQ